MLKRWFPLTGAAALALLLASAGTSRAQFFGFRGGPGFFFPIGPFGAMSPWSGTGGWGYYPGGFPISYAPRYYGGFGGSTAPYNFNMGTFPSYSYGNTYSMGAPNLFAPSIVGVAYYPPLPTTNRGSLIAPAAGLLPADQPATVEITTPADATIWFDGQRTSQTGAQRVFTTPDLVKGKSYHYEVKARWMKDGKPIEQTQRVAVYAGGKVSVVFPTGK